MHPARCKANILLFQSGLNFLVQTFVAFYGRENGVSLLPQLALIEGHPRFPVYAADYLRALWYIAPFFP